MKHLKKYETFTEGSILPEPEKIVNSNANL